MNGIPKYEETFSVGAPTWDDTEEVKKKDPAVGEDSGDIPSKEKDVTSSSINEIFKLPDYDAEAFDKQLEEENPVRIPEPEESKDSDVNWVRSAWSKFQAGSASIGSGVARIPSYIYDFFSIPQNLLAKIPGFSGLEVTSPEWLKDNPIAKYYDKQIEELNKTTKQYDKTISAYIQTGDYKKALGLLGNQVAETLPIMISLGLGGISGVTAVQSITGMGLLSAAEKKKELEDVDMDEVLKTWNATVHGLAEGTMETIGTVKIAAIGKQLYSKVGKKAADKAIKDGFKATFGNAMKKFYPVTGAIGEGVEEAATQFTQNLNDRYTGVDSQRNPFDGVTDAFIVGTAAGGVMTGTITAAGKLAPKKKGAVELSRKPHPDVEEGVPIKPVQKPQEERSKKSEGKVPLKKEKPVSVKGEVKKEPIIKPEPAEFLEKPLEKKQIIEQLVSEGKTETEAGKFYDTFKTLTKGYDFTPKEYLEKQKIKEEPKHAIQEQKAEKLPEAERAEGIQKVEKEIRGKDKEVGEVPIKEKPDVLIQSGVNVLGLEIDDNKVVDFWRKKMTAKGHVPQKVFDRYIKAKGKIHKQLSQVHQTAWDYKKALRKAYGQTLIKTPKVSKEQVESINTALAGIGTKNQTEALKGIPEPLHEVIIDMRNHIDALSREMVRSGMVEGELAPKFKENLGFYLTRTYKKHTDPKWRWEKIPDEIKNNAINFMRKEFPSYSEEKIDGMLRELVYKKDDGILSSIVKGKLGSKDLGIFKRRKDIPLEIRELMGEHKDPLYNYSTSVSKMANLIEKQKFLDETKKIGMGNFLFEEQKGEFHVKIAAEESATMEPLNGLYTTPKIAEAFETFNKSEPIPKWLRGYVKYLNVPVKYGKTILSPVTHARNYYANYLFHVANGRNIFGKESVKAHKVMFDDLKRKGDRGFRDYYNKLVELNVIGESTRAGEVHDAIKESVNYIEEFDKYGDNIYKKTLKKTLRGSEKMYQVEDDVHKVIAFEIEKKRYANVYKKREGISDEEVDRLSDETAASVVRKTMPTYSLVPEAIKTIRRFPLVGTFVSFPAEVVRTTGNTMQLAYEEMKNPETRTIGTKRIAGIITASLITGAMATLSRALVGVDKQDDKDLKRFIAPWSKRSDIVFVKNKGNGVYTYVDAGFSDPYNYLKKPINALLMGEDFKEAAWEAVKQFSEPFLGEEILAARLIDIRRNKKKTSGTPVFNEEASDGDILSQKLKYLWEGVQPGAIYTGKRIAKSFRQDVNEYGGGLTPANELANLFLGLRTSDIDVKRSFSFKIYRGGRRIADAMHIKDKEKSEKSLEKIFNDLNEDYKSALRLGVPPRELDKIVAKLRQGPYNASPQMKRIVRTGEFRGLDRRGKVK